MGKVLQIRVICQTWNVDLVEKMWPKVAGLAFSVPTKFAKCGVLELIQGLAEGLAYLDWSVERQERMGPKIKHLEELKRNLERALGDWQVQEANRLTEQIEIALDELEDNFIA